MSPKRILNPKVCCLFVWLSCATATAAEPAEGAAATWLRALGADAEAPAQTPGGVWIALALLAVALILRQIGKKRRPLPY
jgi:hypothetical protein